MSPSDSSPSASSGSSSPSVPPTWYQDAFRGDYARVYRHRDDSQGEREARRAAEWLSIETGNRVLDLGCGAGRHVRYFQERGVQIIGLDRSAELLAEARRKLGPEALLIRGDMRQIPLASGFDAVLSFFTSFGYFLGDGENRKVLAEIARVLRPGRAFLLDLMDRESAVRELVPHSKRQQDGLAIEERRWISRDGHRVEKEVRLGRGDDSRVYHESVRLYSRDEAEEALASAGLTAERAFGDFEGNPHRPGETPRMILVGRNGAGAP